MLKDATDVVLEKFWKMNPKFENILGYIQRAYTIFCDKISNEQQGIQ